VSYTSASSNSYVHYLSADGANDKAVLIKFGLMAMIYGSRNVLFWGHSLTLTLKMDASIAPLTVADSQMRGASAAVNTATKNTNKML